MRYASCRLCLFLALAVFCPATLSKSLVIGLPLLEPYATQKGNAPSGMYVEILQTVFSQMGIDYTIRVIPPARAIHDFMRGAIDITVFASKTPEASQVMHLSKVPLSVSRVMLMGSANNRWRKNYPVKQQIFSVAAIRGFSPDLSFLPKNKVALVNSRKQLLKMLFAGRVDYIVAAEAISSSFAQQRGFPPLSSICLLEHQSIFVAFSKLRLGDDVETLGIRFDASMRQLIQRGDRERIVERYTGLFQEDTHAKKVSTNLVW